MADLVAVFDKFLVGLYYILNSRNRLQRILNKVGLQNLLIKTMKVLFKFIASRKMKIDRQDEPSECNMR